MSFTTVLSPEWFLTKRLPTDFTELASVKVDGKISVSVYPQWFSHATIRWTVPAKWGNCVFHVYSKLANEVTRLTENAVDDTFFHDMSLRETSKFHQLEYIVEAILLDYNNFKIRSHPTSWTAKRRDWVELRAIEIQRREFMLLSKFVGTKSYLFKKRPYGKRCHRCWNPSSEVVVDDHCPVCYGTSFEGGYFDPIPVYLQYDSTSNDVQKTYAGKFENNQIGAWTISFPEVDVDDVIVRTKDWNIYRVSRNLPTELQNATVRQILTLTQFSRRDVEYKLLDRTDDSEGIAYLKELPSGLPQGTAVAGQRGKFPTDTISPTPTSPDWVEDVPPETLPAKYTI